MRSLFYIGVICFFATSYTNCEKHGVRPKWAQGYYPNYEALGQPFELIALELKEAKDKNKPITKFDELAGAIRKNYPETKVSYETNNPFPGFLPEQNNYQWMALWENVTNGQIPVIWTIVQLQEPTIIYIEAGGETHAEKPAVFTNLLNQAIRNGARVYK